MFFVIGSPLAFVFCDWDDEPDGLPEVLLFAPCVWFLLILFILDEFDAFVVAIPETSVTYEPT